MNFQSISEELGKNKTKIPKQLCNELTLEDGKSFHSEFNLMYLQKCFLHYFTPKVQFYLTDENPLQMKFTLDDNISNIRFFLAPKVEDTE